MTVIPFHVARPMADVALQSTNPPMAKRADAKHVDMGLSGVPKVGAVDRTSNANDLSAFFSAAISGAAGVPTQATTQRYTYRLKRDVMYEWLFRAPSLLGQNPLTKHGFFVPKGTDIKITIQTRFHKGSWHREVQLELSGPPDGLGAWGPMALKNADYPLSSTRLSMLKFAQVLRPDGRTKSEKTHLGLTFADPVSGKMRKPHFAERRKLELSKVQHRGATLYMTDASEAMRAVWNTEAKRLNRAAKRHTSRTGIAVRAGSAASYLALLHERMVSGQRHAKKRHAERTDMARRALNL